MFVFDVICRVRLRNGYVIVLKSVSHYVSVDYSPPLSNALKCDKDHKFTRISHQSLYP